MANNYSIGSIIYFNKYCFSDEKRGALPHYALVVLPSEVMGFESNLLCSVITSNIKAKEDKYCHSLCVSDYDCFAVESFACLNRQDIQSISDLDESKDQPLAVLAISDIKKCFKILKAIKYSTSKQGKYYIATIIREWKSNFVL
ncbi:MAG: hypothetical protein WA091_03460 [Minisyncoccales bacterium]